MTSLRRMVWALTLTISVLPTLADVALTSQNSESSDSPTRAGSELHAKVGKLLSTIEAHLVSPARNRKRSADVAVPATKDPLNQVVYTVCHLPTLRQFAFHLRVLCQSARYDSVVQENCYRALKTPSITPELPPSLLQPCKRTICRQPAVILSN